MEKKLYDLTNPQKSILLTEEYFKGTNINNICGTANIEDEVNFDLLKKAISILIANHDSFHFKLVIDNNEVKQYLDKVSNYEAEIIDINSKDEISKLENSLLNHVFDIYNGDLFCVKIFRLPDNRGGFIFNVHHLFGDSWSLGIVANDIIRIYSSLLNGESINENNSFSYIDYIYSEKEYLNSDKFNKDKAYWTSIYNTIPEQASIPGSYSTSTDDFDCKATRNTFNIDNSLMLKIKEYCKLNRVSVFNFFMAIYAIYIGRVSRLDDFVIGTPILNRTNFKEKSTTGMFINTAPLRFNIDNNLDFKSFVSNIAKDSLGMLRHQKYYYQNILEDLRKDNPNLPGLYNILISYQITNTNCKKGVNYSSKWCFNGNIADDMEIHLYDLNDSGSLDIAYDYRVCKYSNEDISYLHNRILNIIDQIINCDNIDLKNIEIVTNDEKNKILHEFNNTSFEFLNDKCNSIIELIEKSCISTPNAIAIEFNNSFVTYHDLWNRINQLSNYLVSNIDVNSNPNIGILTTRSIDTVIGILAILRINCTYVPIDPQYPIDRINYMVDNSGVKTILLTDMDLKSNIQNSDINFIPINYSCYCNCNNSFDLSVNYNKNSNLYVIFTSGSTGKPKGVTLSHKNMLNLILFEKYKTNIFSNSSNKVLQFATMSFDVSYQEIFSSLITSSTLVLIDDSTRKDMNLLTNYIIDKNIDTLFIPPAYLKLLCEDNNNIKKLSTCVKNIITAGEALTITDGISKLIKNGIKIHNHYGPAETHVATTYTLANSYNEINVPIGYPISNSYIYILDNTNNLCPINTIGQIVISGACVGNGYFNNTDLSSEKFINDPFNPNNVMYLTGDLGFFDAAGCVHYIGRSDFQVKINGFRIELGEIDKILLDYSDVLNCVSVIQETNNKKHIICFYTSNSKLEETVLKEYLKKSLPNYMMPSRIIQLDSLPINNNGKIDKKRLPQIDFKNFIQNFVQPVTPTEIKLANLWKNIFNIDKVGNNYDFFELGGDSLLAIKLISIINDTFSVNITVADVFKYSTLQNLAKCIDSCNVCNNNVIVKTPNMDYYPLSSAQKRIYFACKKLGDDTLAYNITGGLLVNKLLDKTKLIDAVTRLVNRHSSFRTLYTVKDNIVVQCIKDTVTIDVPVFYDTANNINTILHSYQKSFNLEKDLLFRFSIYYLDNNKTLLLIDSHHIALDGVSLDIFIKEFCDLYNGKTLEDLKIDYKDFAVWENDFVNTDKFKELEDYWINKFKDSGLPSVNLPYDYVNSDVSKSSDIRVNYTMSKELFEIYEDFAKKLNISNYTLFLSVLLILLYKYTNQEELVIGSTTVGRENSELYNIIGTFVNNIVIDAKMKSNQAFIDFVKYINSQVINDLAHQAYPYDMLVKKLSNMNNSYKDSLFDVSFTYQNANTNTYSIENDEVQVLDMYSNTSKFNLLLEIQPKNYMFSFEYNNTLFKKETIESLLEHYLFVLSQVVQDANILIDNINIVTDKELQLLEKFNNTYEEINNDTFVSLFEKEVHNNPDNIALICNNETLTYNELNIKANSLAHYLIKNGIGANDIVCIMTNRSFETVICMLGILKAGAAFFNVDPTYPIERTKYYIADSKTKYVLTQKSLKDKVAEIENCIEIDLDNNEIYNYNFDNPNVIVDGNDLSYIIYTSGSTGTPKGVMLNQVGLANMVKAMYKVLDYLKEGNKHAIASVTSTPFDIFVYEIVVSLAHGLKVVMANNAEHRNPKLLDTLIRKHHVDVMTVTPSLMKINYDNREPNSALALVKNMVFGGEPLPEKFVNDLRALADDITIYNIYGPSEITVLSNVQNLNGEKEITIGPPIMNTQIHILDKNMKRVPIGVVGEIYISGIQVGRGYIGKEDLTKERFMDNPFGEGKIYKSGDIGRWTFDGKVQCLGRVDHQIKLRGLRIELGEIENVMQNISGVSASVVNKIEIDNKEVLCGYYVADSSVEEATVKETLRSALPYYMVPTYIIRLDEMPYTINRKIDRKSLPLPELNKTISNKKVNIKELNSNEEKLLEIWKSILKVDHINIDDNFFDIGGDSISAINMQIEALKYGLTFEYADIFNYPTISQLSSKLPSPIDNFMNNYDYSKVNEVLKRNTIENLNTIKKLNINNVLLIGATGYLGAHIIDEFMKNNTGIIYCLIRPKNNKLPSDRLKEILNFYFKDTYDNEINNRIKIVCGDITQDNIGLSSLDYTMLKNNIDVVINSGAIVKHFGQKDEFESINIHGTQNVVDFCVNENKRLLHISTISISGNGEKEETIEETPENINDKKLFYETDIFIDQNIKGIYTTTKYKAELIVLEAIANGLDAQILRLGNITNRYSDGLFQLNVDDNAFAKRLKSFIEMGAIPRYLLQHAIELTPVDLCANAIIKILQHSSNCNVLHIYNSKLLPVKLLVDTLNSIGIELEAISDKLLQNVIVGILNDDKQKDILSGIIYDLDNEHRLIYTSNVRVKYDFSEAYLNAIGFYWSNIDENYVKKYINYFKEIGFINC